MKIALIYDAVYPWIRGGGEVNVRQLASLLVTQGHQVDVVGMKWWEGDPVRVEEGVTLRGVSRSVPLYREDGRRRLDSPLWFAAGALRWLSRASYDVVDCCAFPYFPALGLAPLLRARGIPLTLTWFEVWGAYWKEYLGTAGLVAQGIEAQVARGSRFHLAISPLTAEKVQALAPRARVRMIPSAVSIPTLPEMIPEPFTLGWCSRALPYKNLPLLLDALALLPGEFPFRLKVIGDGPSLEDWKRYAAIKGISNRVEWLGFLPDHREVFMTLGKCQAVVQTSTREGQGRAALETLALGRPLILVRHPAVATVGFLEDGESALLVPENNPQALAEALMRLVRTPGLEETLKEGAGKVAASLRWESLLPQILEHYREVAGSGKGSVASPGKQFLGQTPLQAATLRRRGAPTPARPGKTP